MSEPTDSNKVWRGLNTVLTILLISTPLFLVQIFGASASSVDSLPVSIRATSQADYNPDSQTFLIPLISENILNQLITNIPATSSGEDRLATLQAGLSSPVPTMTGNAPAVMTPTPTLPSQILTSTAVVTTTTPIATTPLATATPRVTSTPIAGSTATPGLPLPLPTIVTIPSSVPTIPSILPTVMPLIPTIPPLLPTVAPLIPTITSLLPTLIPPLFP